MSDFFRVNPQLDIPIYQQLVDAVRIAVKKGELTPGQQLPTVQELSSHLSIARGTIKRAYDELEHLGFLEKIQGRGTFVSYQPENSSSRKERAMAAIDGLLDELEEMGFSAAEIEIYLTLKQRERAAQLSTLKIAVVECNTEALSQLSEQLHSIKGIELFCYLQESIRQYPYKLDEDIDLVITTANHADYIADILPDPTKLTRVALRLSTDTLSGILRLQPGEQVQILSFSSRFGDLVQASCLRYVPGVSTEARLFADAVSVPENGKILVPRDYEKYCSEELARGLKAAQKQGRVLLCGYKLDEGSFLHVEERLEQLRQGKNRV